MIELFEQNIRTNDRQSSKGNQLKWRGSGIRLTMSVMKDLQSI